MEASALARWVSATGWVYPAANVAHVLGVIVMIGAVAGMDLRLLGAGRSLPLGAVMRLLAPAAWAGFGVLALSGFVLFAADAVALSRSPIFGAKLLMIAAAGANAVLFTAWYRHQDGPPIGARAQALISLGLWLGAVIAGRLIAYF